MVYSDTKTAARSIEALFKAISGLEDVTALKEIIGEAAARTWYTPHEEVLLFSWFGRLLTVRSFLLETIEELSGRLESRMEALSEPEEWRCFVLGYAAACLLVRLDRLLVEETALDTLTQRKLNEGCERQRIPRKQYTMVYKSLANPRNAWRMKRAMDFAASNRTSIQALRDDATVGFLVRALLFLEEPLDPSKSRYFKLLLNYREHSTRRRGIRAIQETGFTLLEWAGRGISELRANRPKKVTSSILNELEDLLQPGDVIATRHKYALSNLFLPGFWPHTALYLGPSEGKAGLGLSDTPETEKWCGSLHMLEAQKDGVLLRPISETLAVDAVAVIRPRLAREDIGRGLLQALEHEGKLYNFDFDFFRSDRLVCTEVVYRAFEGIGPMNIGLQQRAGRPTLSAEDLLDLALAGEMFEVVAIFGVGNCEDQVVTGPDAWDLLRASYISDGRLE